jgi:hypothetical protein
MASDAVLYPTIPLCPVNAEVLGFSFLLALRFLLSIWVILRGERPFGAHTECAERESCDCDCGNPFHTSPAFIAGCEGGAARWRSK